MRIVIDGRLYGLENAGLGRYVMNLVENLQLIDSKNDYTILLRKKYYDELKLNKNWKKELAEFRHYSVNEQIILPKLLNNLKYDLVHFPHFNVPIFFRGEFIVTIHDLLMHYSKGKGTTNLPWYKYQIKRMSYYLVFEKAVKSSLKIITPSKYVKSEVVNNFNINPQKISVVYEGIDQSGFKKSLDQNILNKYAIDGSYLVYTGNAYPHKNLITAIKGVVMYNENHREKCKLYIISSRDVFTKKIKQDIKNLNAQESVSYLGFLNDHEMSSVLSRSKAFIYPSLSEGFGLQGLEAMASETLLLASDIPVFKEIYKKHAIYFDPKSPESIADAIENVMTISDKERSKRLKQAKEFSKGYSWKQMANETLEVYNTI